VAVPSFTATALEPHSVKATAAAAEEAGFAFITIGLRERLA
jgi:hypothetical protein